MSENPRFKIRFMQDGEANRLSELVVSLQVYQKMKKCPRLPTGEDLTRELTHKDQDGIYQPNNFGTFTALAIDMDKTTTPGDHSNIVGYLVYIQSFSIIHGRTFYITSFFIEEKYRRHGLGRKFIEFLRLHGKLVGNYGFDVPFMNDNHIGQKFYRSYGSYLVNEEYFLMKASIDF